MATKPLPDVEMLRKLLDYDPETGILTWKLRDVSMFRDAPNRTATHACNRWNAQHAGKPAFSGDTQFGHRRGRILGSFIMAHRVAWAMHHGQWPVDQIDHINGDPADNRIENLRDVPGKTNARNKPRYKTNKTGVAGVYWHNSAKLWGASISHGGKQRHLGCFADINDAISARKTAEIACGYHKNHGR